MLELYKRILTKNKNIAGLKTVDSLISDSGFTDEVNNKLIALGYPIQSMSSKQKAILFTALVDIIVVVKGSSYYLATFNTDKIRELHNLGRIIPNVGETDLLNVDKIVRNNTKEIICQYILKNKFHLIRLNVYDKCRTSFTLVSITSMNPYPSFDGQEMVYGLTSLADWHNEVSNALIRGICKLSTTDGDIVCQNYMSKTKSVCTGGVVIAKDVNNNLIEVPIWKIKSYEPYNDNDFIQKLYRGIVKYDDYDITLNRDLLEKYYGTRNMYRVLESQGVRYRYCLEELLSIGNKYIPEYYINKYNLGIRDCKDIYDLQSKLRVLISREKREDNCIINARVLTSVNSILSGHKHYYIKINISKLQNHEIQVVENISDVMPKEYKYYGISSSLGYNCCVVTATSDNLAFKYGETEFERQFGKSEVFCGLVCGDKVIKGSRPYKIGINIQRSLCQNIMYGYTQNFRGYADVIYKILKENNINNCTDEMIQLLYINQLARVCKQTDIKFKEVMKEFIAFCDLLTSPEKLASRLKDEKIKISYRRCVKEFSSIENALPNLQGYQLDVTPEGKYIVTKYGRFKLGSTGVNKTVDLYYNDEFLCSKIIKK